MGRQSSRLHELRRESEWRRCAADPAYFLEHYVCIKHPRRKRILFELRPAQRDTLAALVEHRYVIILKARQIGYSTLLAAYALWRCLFHSDEYVVFLSIGEREAKKLLAKAKYAYRFLPEWLRARGPALLSDHQQIMAFGNDSLIESLPSKKDPARGESVTLVVVDEWASFENPEEAWSAIEPIADVGGSIVGLSTAKGYGNFFHEMWVRARTGASEFAPLFYPWSANNERDADWYAAKARANPEWLMAQEYPRNEDEAFLKSGNPVFDLDVLAGLDVTSPRAGELVQEGSAEWWAFRELVDGALRLWSLPHPHGSYAIGADVAQGLDHGDYSSAHVIDTRDGEVVAHWHGHVPADEFGAVLYGLGRWYRNALVGVEVNNHGLTTVTELKRLGYPRIYYKWTLNQQTNRRTKELGWRTTAVSKPLMIDHLARALKDGSVGLHCERTVAELRTYVRNDGKMEGSPFDDRVVSLAIALQMVPHVYAPEFAEPADDYLTLNWWRRQLSNQKPGGTILGRHNSRDVAA